VFPKKKNIAGDVYCLQLDIVIPMGSYVAPVIFYSENTHGYLKDKKFVVLFNVLGSLNLRLLVLIVV